MSMSNVAEAAMLDLLFLNTDWADVGDAAGLQNSATAGNFYIALHTADPGEAGDQTTSEAAYTSYARVAVPRSGVGFTRTVSTIANAALVQFPQCTGGSASVTHFTVGTAASGAGSVIVRGALSSTLAISNGIQPQFAAGALSTSVE